MSAFPATVAENANVLDCIPHLDHITYVTKFENERVFVERWKLLGFDEHVRFHTSRFPATHIALVRNNTKTFNSSLTTMTWLSVSSDPQSPLNEFVRRYGEGMQHTAYSIDPKVSMEELQQQMKQLSWNFMTPVLSYKNASGTILRQMFTAPIIPYGPFIEFVQRLDTPDENAFDSFDTTTIDDLYQYYVNYSHSLTLKSPDTES